MKKESAANDIVGQRKLGNLEIIRFLAASMVVFFHLQEKFAVELGLLPELNSALGIFGAAGVDIFFVVSGFVIALNVSNPKVSSVSFLGARAARIIPSYWLLTLLAAATMFAVPSQFQREISFVDIWTSMTFLNTQFGIALPVISMGWTLNLEILFYLLVTISLLLARKNRLATQIIASVALVAAVFLAGADALLLEFLFGFVAFWLWRVLPQSIFLGTLFLSSSIVFFMLWFGSQSPFEARWLSFGLPAFCLVMAALFYPQVKFTFVKKLGFASYSIYLTQWFSIPGGIIAIQLFEVDQTFAVVGFVCCLLASLVSGFLYSELVDRQLYSYSRRILRL